MKGRSDGGPMNFTGLITQSLRDRKSKVETGQFSTPPRPGSSFREFINSLPDLLAAREFREVVSCIVAAARNDKMILVGMGAHPIKVGLGPTIIALMERGVVKGLAMNGAGVIHDVEIAMAGKTSEEVGELLETGLFGSAREPAEFINAAVQQGYSKGWGMGMAVGKAMREARLPHEGMSVCAATFRLNLPLTVHVAIGTDVVHMHPSTDGAALGELTYRDFRIFASLVASLDGGAYINIGSAVIMPEVFLKALSAARNLGHIVDDFLTVNMDCIQHYRPLQNVVRRPTAKSGKGIALTGHHEIMLPLLAAAVVEELDS